MSASKSTEELICNRTLAKSLIQKARDIKMLPEVAVRAIAVADNPDAKIQDLANIVSQDAMLATSILSLSNSPLFPVYACGKSISCLKMAITRLGFRQTKQMILVSSYSSMVSKLSNVETKTRDLLSKHSFLTGCIATELNRLFKLGIQGEEFTAGLVHDIGRMLLAATIPEQFSVVDSLDFDEAEDLLEKEQSLLGTDHAKIGGWFLRRNQITEELVNVALHHHAPNDSVQYTRLVALISVADDLANHHQRDPGNLGAYDSSNIEGLKLLETLGAIDAAAKYDEHWPEVLDQAIQTSNQILG
jgi:HD-like signal output (HDOD) protein